MNILVINGPNLNLLGTREPSIYGNETLDEIMAWLENSIEGSKHSFKFYQSNSEGEIINNEKVLADLKNIPEKVDIVDVFRPSKETPGIANQAKAIGSKVLWLQYGIHSDEAKEIAASSDMEFISNRCIKQEYQKIFQKSNPVFPALKK